MAQLKNNDEIRKTALGQPDDSKTGCLLDSYFKSNYQLIPSDIGSKQKVLDCDPVAIQQIDLDGDLRTKSEICTFIENLRKQF